MKLLTMTLDRTPKSDGAQASDEPRGERHHLTVTLTRRQAVVHLSHLARQLEQRPEEEDEYELNFLGELSPVGGSLTSVADARTRILDVIDRAVFQYRDMITKLELEVAERRDEGSPEKTIAGATIDMHVAVAQALSHVRDDVKAAFQPMFEEAKRT